MQFLRKRLFLLFAIMIVYAAFFLTHIPHNSSTKTVLGVSSNLQLFEQPIVGKDPLLSAINAAQKEVDVEVYLLSDKDIIASLEAACGRGVIVEVMLEQHPFGGGIINQKTGQALQSSCVHSQWTNPAFSLTHEKTILIDHQEVFILNQNLTAASFKSNREYDIADVNVQDVSEIQNIFSADWKRSSITLSDPNLVVSPVNSRDRLTTLISSATKDLFIETEVIDDPGIVQLLEKKAQSIPIHIIIPSFSQVSSNKKNVSQLMQSGINVETMSSPYVHAKLIIADETKAYVGSVNLTTQSMDANREVGIIISQPDIVTQLIQDFTDDWQKVSGLSI